LCGRSPKDGEPTDPAARRAVWAGYQATLQKIVEEEGQPLDGNTRVAAIARAPSYLRVRSGADAMSLILTSERVFSDMLDWLKFGEPEQIVLREWSDSFDVSSEFRCYVEHDILLGISQYDTYAQFDFLQEASNRATVIRAVVNEWAVVRDCIETIEGSYCADFGVDMQRGKAHLIELSPFRRCTGPALFAWKNEAQLVFPDRRDVQDDPISCVIQHKHVAKGALFRFRSEVIPGIEDLVEMNWDLRWSDLRVDTPKKYRDLYAKAVQSKTSLVSQISGWFFYRDHVLFTYGTLKRNCHWHSKYLTGAQFIGDATTEEPHSLVVGQCGVPYLIRISPDDKARPVRGELWRISDEMLRGIDEYEGIYKGHYTREEIATVVMSGATGTREVHNAFCYFYAVKPGASDVDTSLSQAERISEYSAEEQKKRYKPIHHIQVKQLQYLGEEATT